MIVTAWIVLVVFGFIGFRFTLKLSFRSISKSEAVLWVFCVIITALSAGVIFGGLFKGILW